MRLLNVAVACALAAAALLSLWNLATASQDSITILRFARIFGEAHHIPPESKYIFATLPPFVLAVHGGAPFLKMEYLYAFHPYFFLSFITTFFYLTGRALSHADRPGKINWVVAALVLATLLSSYFVVFQAFYIHSNMTAGAYLFLFAATFWLSLAERNRVWLIFSMMALLAFTLCRSESAPIAAIFLMPLLASERLTQRSKIACVVPYAAVSAGWFFLVSRWIGTFEHILTPRRAAAMCGVFMALGVLASISIWPSARRVLSRGPWLTLCGLGAACLVFLLLRPRHVCTSVMGLWANLVTESYWGFLWWFIGGALVLAFWAKPLEEEMLFSASIPSFLLTIILMTLFRDPYHAGWGDSGNRMMTHILPLTLFYLALKHGRGCGEAELATAHFDPS